MKLKGSIIFIFTVHLLLASSVDSLRIQLEQVDSHEQYTILQNIPFNTIVENSHEIVHLLKEYANKAKDEEKFGVLAQIYENLSLAYYYQGNYDQNMQYGYKAIHLYDSLGDKPRLGNALGELGYQTKRRDLKLAFDIMRRAIRILEPLQLKEQLANTYDNYGVLHEMDKNIDSAVYFYKKAMHLKKQRNDSIGIPYSLNNLFIVFLISNQYDSAKYYLEESTRRRQQLNDQVGLAENMDYWGDLYHQQGKYNLALDKYMQAVELAGKLDYRDFLKVLYEKISIIYQKEQRFKEALQYHILYKQMQDSIINMETNREIARLEVQYKTAEKEKALMVKNQQLKFEKRLKIYLGIFALLLIIGLWLFYRYRLSKSRQQEQISVRNALIEGEEKERGRLAAELHDGIAGDLSGNIFQIEHLNNELNNQQVLKLNDIVGKLRQTHQSVRKMSHVLMPPALKNNGLQTAIKDLINNYQSDEIQFQQQMVGMDVRFDNQIELNLYRIVQECVSNIIKHAKAANVFIAAQYVDGIITLTIEDDGVGFDMQKNGKRGGLGLRNIQNRVKLMNGKIHINSQIGQGTTTEIQIEIK